MTLRSALYSGTVVHERRRPKRHRLRYNVFSMLFDLDELEDLDRRFRLFGYNRWAPLSFHDRDHGPLTGGPLRPWIAALLADAGLVLGDGRVTLLCYPRVMGHVFNPLSVYFCHDTRDRLIAILYEVCNTFGERHTYVIPVTYDDRPVIRQTCAKALYVSPFVAMNCSYKFRILPPSETVGIVIREEDDDGLLLAAAFSGQREALTERALATCLLRFPFLTLKVVAGIHWEAMKLWFKGLPVFRHHPAPARLQSTIVSRAPRQSATDPS